MRVWPKLVVLVLVMGGVAQAAPLALQSVPADAQWLAHLDVDAIRDSTLARDVWTEYAEQCPQTDMALTVIRMATGMDPIHDLHGITVYGKKTGRPEGVLILQADVNRKLLEEKVKYAPDHKTAKHGPYEIHTWTQKGRHHEHLVAGAFHKPGVLVFASSVDELKAALDLLDQKGASLAGKSSDLAAAVPGGAWLVGRAAGLSQIPVPVKSPLVTQSDRLSFAVGESGSKVFFRSALTTRSSEVANQVKQVIDGAKALALLQHGDHATAKVLVNAVHVTVANNTVSTEFQAPVDTVWKQVVEAVKHAREHHKRFMEFKKKVK